MTVLASPTISAPFRPGPRVVGVALAAVACALFTPIFAMGKLIDGAAPAIAIVMMRYIGGAATVVAAARLGGVRFSALKSDRPALHAARAALGVGGGACAIQAATMIPIAEATAIGLVKGVLIVALAGLLLSERIPMARWLAAGLCALGALWVVAPSLGGFGEPVSTVGLSGAGFALVGALCIALEALLIKVIARREPSGAALFQVNVFGALIAAPLGIAAAAASAAPVALLAALALTGPLAIAAQYCNLLAYRRADASTLGPVGYLSILFAALFGFAAFGEVPNWSTATGGALIVIGGVWLARGR